MYVLIFILVALYLRRFQDQRMYIMIASAIIPFIGVLVMSLMPNTPEHKWLKWGMFDVTVVFSLALFLGWSMSKSSFAAAAGLSNDISQSHPMLPAEPRELSCRL
jgi:cyanate permease